jgi:predicted DNA-binding transcriptional regulator AlpA
LSKKSKTALGRRRLRNAPTSLPATLSPRQPPTFSPHPHRLYRVERLADLFDVDRATIWRWRKAGLLPPFVEIGGVSGLTEEQVSEVLKQRRETVNA